jgi:plasmid stability protein
LRSCRVASTLLAFCDMSTLYLRNVPDEVVERLKRLAEREGTSVNAVAVRELADSSRRADNPALLGALPDLGVDPATIAADLDAERASR